MGKGQCFMYANAGNEKTRDLAMEECSKWGGRLWEPKNQNTFNAVLAEYKREDTGLPDGVDIWFGISHIGDDITKGWSYSTTSEELTYSNWKTTGTKQPAGDIKCANFRITKNENNNGKWAND